MKLRILAGAGLIILAGCKTTQSSSIATAHPVPVASLEERVNIPEGWTPNTLADIALVRHPILRAAQLRAMGKSEQPAQQGALPDPMVGITGGDLAETAAGQAVWMARAEQAFPGPGKLDARVKAANAKAEAAAFEAQVLALELTKNVQQVAWRHFLADRSTTIHRETQDVLEQVRDSVDARAAAGRASQQDQLRVASELGRIDQALIRSEQQKTSAQAQLNGLLVRATGAPFPSSGVGQTPTLLSHEDALERLPSHPEILALSAHRNAAEQMLRQARLSRTPDYVVGVQYTQVDDSGLAPSANGDDQVAATIGLRIPLWPAPRAASIRESELGLMEVDARIQAILVRLQAEAESAWFQVDAASRQAALLEKQLIPESEQAFDLVQSAYASGKQEFVDVIDSWRQMLALRLQHAQILAERGQAFAALNRATNIFPPSPRVIP